MNPELQNWENFCKYQASGDWYGTWKKYSPQGEVTDFFWCIRSMKVNDDGSEIHHQNHYTYADGKTETKNFGVYQKPKTRALFLDNSFSWGSITVTVGEMFGFETGFRYEDRRASVAAIYDSKGELEHITVIPEHLGIFSETSFSTSEIQINENWRGTLKTMTPNFVVSYPVTTNLKKLEELGTDYLVFNFGEGISISLPPKIESGKEFLIAVDWLVNPNTLQRGIRNYNTPGFTSFTLEVGNKEVTY